MSRPLHLRGGEAAKYESSQTIIFKMEKKTSQEWLESIPKEHNLKVLDPDGWDRQNFDYSFNEEKIEREEFDRRLSSSTIQCNHSFFRLNS